MLTPTASLPLRVAALLLAPVALLATAHPATPAPRRPALYLLAATPDIYGMYGFPVTLYTVGPSGRTQRARRIFTFAPGFMDVRPDGRSRIYVVDENGLSIIHEADPGRNDLVLAPGPNSIRRGAPVTNWAACGYWVAWGVVLGPRRRSGAVFADSKHCTGPGLEVVRVAGDPQRGLPRVALAPWAVYRGYIYFGHPGGPLPTLAPSVKISGSSLGEPDTMGPMDVAIGTAPPALARPAGGRSYGASGPSGSVRTQYNRSASLLLDTRAYLAIRAPLPGRWGAWPKRIYVHSRQTGRWFTLKLPYMEIPPRLFGDWLCTIVQEPNPNELPSPGLENERRVVYRPDGNPYPNIRGAYKPDMYMPGVLELRNLATGRVVKIFTGQQDSEVLGVAADGRVAYRVNDRVLVARMRGRGVGPAVLAAEGPDVPEVHWIFCRGGGDIGACLAQPPSGAAAPPRNEVQHDAEASH